MKLGNFQFVFPYAHKYNRANQQLLNTHLYKFATETNLIPTNMKDGIGKCFQKLTS